MIGGKMSRKTRQTFTQDFKLEAAQLVLDQNYSVREAASAMYIGKSTMDKLGTATQR
jgi:transposase